jgi:hypothetical protein
VHGQTPAAHRRNGLASIALAAGSQRATDQQLAA